MLLLLYLLLMLLSTIVRAVDVNVKTGCTVYKGKTVSSGVNAWLGVPYAAAPIGALRFMAPKDFSENCTEQAAVTVSLPLFTGLWGVELTSSEEGKACLSTGQKPPFGANDEDCLNLDIYAPADAKPDSRLPVFFFIPGGGFNGQGPNGGGDNLIRASDMKIVVVIIHYRVGLFGFLSSKDVEASGSLNNGLKDQIKALQWVSKNIRLFGGDPDHITIGGASAGGASVTHHLTFFGGEYKPLFHAAAASSQSFGKKLTLQQSQYQYDNLASQTGCDKDVGKCECPSGRRANSTFECMKCCSAETLLKYSDPIPYTTNSRGKSTDGSSQSTTKELYMWGPVVDKKLVPDFLERLYHQGRFVKVPVIYGNDNNEGASFAPKDTASLAASNQYLKDQFPTLSNQQIDDVQSYYPKGPQYPGKGAFFGNLSMAYGEMRYICPGEFISSASSNNSVKVWNYHYNVTSAESWKNGDGVGHTAEQGAIWGKDGTGVAPIIRHYWISFILHKDPNKSKYSESPEWENWTDEKKNRIVLMDQDTQMEAVPQEQQRRCEHFASLAVNGISQQ